MNEVPLAHAVCCSNMYCLRYQIALFRSWTWKQFPAPAYVGSSRNPKDLKVLKLVGIWWPVVRINATGKDDLFRGVLQPHVLFQTPPPLRPSSPPYGYPRTHGQSKGARAGKPTTPFPMLKSRGQGARFAVLDPQASSSARLVRLAPQPPPSPTPPANSAHIRQSRPDSGRDLSHSSTSLHRPPRHPPSAQPSPSLLQARP